MEYLQVRCEKGFEVLAGTERSEAATMVLQAGETTGGPNNTHAGDQWLFVLKGRGTGIVNGAEVPLLQGTLLLIEAGEAHQITAGGEAPLETLNVYAPPEY